MSHSSSKEEGIWAGEDSSLKKQSVMLGDISAMFLWSLALTTALLTTLIIMFTGGWCGLQ